MLDGFGKLNASKRLDYSFGSSAKKLYSLGRNYRKKVVMARIFASWARGGGINRAHYAVLLLLQKCMGLEFQVIRVEHKYRFRHKSLGKT